MAVHEIPIHLYIVWLDSKLFLRLPQSGVGSVLIGLLCYATREAWVSFMAGKFVRSQIKEYRWLILSGRKTCDLRY